MHTNIDANHAIRVISVWLDSLTLSEGFPLEMVKEVIALVMCNNIFELGGMYLLQLLATAMGTSAACIWATLYFTMHDMGTLTSKFGARLPSFRCFIDDIIGIWMGTPGKNSKMKLTTLESLSGDSKNLPNQLTPST